MVERAVDRPPPLQDDIDKATEQKYNEIYQTSKGATADYFSSISLVNRYCTSLPRDEFTEVLPQWELNTENDKFQVTIYLPIQSQLRNEIIVSVFYWSKIER